MKDLKLTLTTFDQLELMAPIQRALAEENYSNPTPIQAQTIPPAMDGLDVLGCAQTGTGKTAAFALPILHRLGQLNPKPVPNRPQVLVLAPTRELAIQIDESFAAYGRHLRLRRALIYGGVGQGNQVRALDQGAHILVATPGRLLDLMNQGFLQLDQLKIFVLDEADRMLDMGFLPDLKRIIARLPKKRQSLFFSATLPPRIMELAQSLLHDPVNINVTPKSTSVERIDQQVLFVERSKKLSMLRLILGKPDVYSAIVFTKTKRGANQVAEKLTRHGIEALPIHGNKSQNARQRALEAFRSNKIQVLVATDLAARGIDIDGITHVVNFDLPVEPESYVHRIGRTARAGATGIALSFCSSAEKNELRAIEQFIGKKIPAAPNQPRFEDLESEQPDARTPARGRRPSSRTFDNTTDPRRPQRSGSDTERQTSGPDSRPRRFGRRPDKAGRLDQAGSDRQPASRRDQTAGGTADRPSDSRTGNSRRRPQTRPDDRSAIASSARSGSDGPGRRPRRNSADAPADRSRSEQRSMTERSSESRPRRSADAPANRTSARSEGQTSSRSVSQEQERSGRSETRAASAQSSEARRSESRSFGQSQAGGQQPPRRRRRGSSGGQRTRQTNENF